MPRKCWSAADPQQSTRPPVRTADEYAGHTAEAEVDARAGPPASGDARSSDGRAVSDQADNLKGSSTKAIQQGSLGIPRPINSLGQIDVTARLLRRPIQILREPIRFIPQDSNLGHETSVGGCGFDQEIPIGVDAAPVSRWNGCRCTVLKISAGPGMWCGLKAYRSGRFLFPGASPAGVTAASRPARYCRRVCGRPAYCKDRSLRATAPDRR